MTAAAGPLRIVVESYVVHLDRLSCGHTQIRALAERSRWRVRCAECRVIAVPEKPA